MNKQPLISIIIATYNARLSIEKTIESIINQSYTNFELIIIDGGSTDGTQKVIEKWSDKINYSISEADEGIYDAWNKGINVAKGDWITFLGAGDEYLPDALQNYVGYIINLNEPSLEYVSSIVKIVNKDGKWLYNIGSTWEWPKYLSYMTIAHVGSLQSKKLFSKYGQYDTNYKLVGDYELLLRAGPNLKAGYMPQTTAKMLFGGMSISKASLKEAFIVKLKSGYLSPQKVYFRYYFSLLKASIRFFLYKIRIYVIIRK
jgi:glycosyltransferase involved in cell wall biosynthesis